ncbi:hypothetical protein GGI15_003891 [Coemansia interrupta]|uniref:RRM domain-containing protein n=1 Tax=Coemansia interrupta TaxID=1126814 RepID=A0A9W8H6V4_9FUNG|nr:hypothetical protein GGI15_003891 [Coemansia interrupta]
MSSANLDKSLDEIINSSQRSGRGRRGGNQSSQRNSPYARRDGGIQKSGNGGRNRQNQNQQAAAAAQSMMFNPAAFLAAAQQQTQTSGKILISNLDYGVTSDDLRTLFSQVGPVSKAMLNFNASGKSNGTGEVTFRNASHATLAVEKYHGVTLDGRAMKIEVAFNPMSVAPMMMPAMIPGQMMAAGGVGNVGGGGRGAGRRSGNSGNNNNNNSGNRNNGGRSGNRNNAGTGGARRGGRGEGRRNEKTPVTKESLDADLDSYMMDADKTA